jgi:uncharacterized membrane protein YcaP (DUF421 family)
MWFDSWPEIGCRTFAVGILVYLVLVAVLRLSGKRTLATMNAFDLVVTVALGSTLATALLSADVTLAEGVAALILLVAVQFAVAWSAARSAKLRRLVKSQPSVLAWHGNLISNSSRLSGSPKVRCARPFARPATEIWPK